MKRFHFASVLVILVATSCSKSELPPIDDDSAKEKTTIGQDEVEAKKAAAPVARYVLASTLSLRAEPSAKAKRIGRVAINSPLQVLSEVDGFANVKVKNGKVGYVAAAFLADAPTTLEGALAKSKDKDPKVALEWAQRAAAISPTEVKVLKVLEAAYKAASKPDSGARVARLIARLDKRFIPVVRGDEGFALEWSVEHGEPLALETIPKSKWNQVLGAKDPEVWILPTRGKAVRASVAKVRSEVVNECGGSTGIRVYLKMTLDEGDEPLIAHVGAPPTSWGRALVGLDELTVGTLKNKALAFVKAKKKFAKENATLNVYPTAKGWAGEYAVGIEDEEIGMVRDWTVTRLNYRDGKWSLSGEAKEDPYVGTKTRRDVDGDPKTLERVEQDGCLTILTTEKGEKISASKDSASKDSCCRC